jgi:hypothetical protein
MVFQRSKYVMWDSWRWLLRQNQSLELLFDFGRWVFIRWAVMLSGVVCRSWEGPIHILFSFQFFLVKRVCTVLIGAI